MTLRQKSPLSLRLLLSLRPRSILAQRLNPKLRLTQSLRLKLRLVSRLKLELMLRQVGVIHAGTERWQLSRDIVLLRLVLELLPLEEPFFVADKRARTAPVQLEQLQFVDRELQELVERDRFVREE